MSAPCLPKAAFFDCQQPRPLSQDNNSCSRSLALSGKQTAPKARAGIELMPRPVNACHGSPDFSSFALSPFSSMQRIARTRSLTLHYEVFPPVRWPHPSPLKSQRTGTSSCCNPGSVWQPCGRAKIRPTGNLRGRAGPSWWSCAGGGLAVQKSQARLGASPKGEDLSGGRRHAQRRQRRSRLVSKIQEESVWTCLDFVALACSCRSKRFCLQVPQHLSFKTPSNAKALNEAEGLTPAKEPSAVVVAGGYCTWEAGARSSRSDKAAANMNQPP